MEVEEIDWKKPRGYQDLIEAVSHYNTSLTVERVAGCPYVDGQTGIAMVSTHTIFIGESNYSSRSVIDMMHYYNKHGCSRG